MGEQNCGQNRLSNGQEALNGAGAWRSRSVAGAQEPPGKSLQQGNAAMGARGIYLHIFTEYATE